MGDPVGEGVDVALAEIGDDYGELVSAEPRDRVPGPEALTQPVGDRDEQTVTGLVTEAVVDRLEVVEVHIQHGQVAAAATALRERGSKPVAQYFAVG